MAKPLPSRIETDAEYDELLGRLVSGSKKLADPLLDESERVRFMAAYDKIEKLVREYRLRG